MLGFVDDDVFLGHLSDGAHPERPERLVAARRALANAGVLTHGVRAPVRPATRGELEAVHDAAFLDRVLATLESGGRGTLDADTYFGPGSLAAAMSAAGASVELVDKIVTGVVPRGLALLRPPGHHALRGESMGFCVLNNVAIAAAAARAAGLARVAIVDWDVHHGNGTEQIFWDDPSVLFVSVHQFPFYPGTGAASDVGGGAGRGTTVNVPLPAGSGDAELFCAFETVVLPALRHHRPELILVSAGFDAWHRDPLGGLAVTAAGFRAVAWALRVAADELAGGRLVALLEGGYDLDGLTACVGATLDAWLPGATAAPLRAAGGVAPLAAVSIESARRFWEEAHS